MYTVLIVVLLVLVLGGLPQITPHPYGYWPSGGLGLVLVVLLVLLLLGRL